jgi:hypothetical protein
MARDVRACTAQNSEFHRQPCLSSRSKGNFGRPINHYARCWCSANNVWEIAFNSSCIPPVVAERTGPIKIVVNERMAGLITTSGFAEAITPKVASSLEPRPWLPLLTPPQILGVTQQDPILTNPCFRAPKELRNTWKHRPVSPKLPLVGLGLRGNL